MYIKPKKIFLISIQRISPFIVDYLLLENILGCAWLWSYLEARTDYDQRLNTMTHCNLQYLSFCRTLATSPGTIG